MKKTVFTIQVFGLLVLLPACMIAQLSHRKEASTVQYSNSQLNAKTPKTQNQPTLFDKEVESFSEELRESFDRKLSARENKKLQF